MERVAFLVDATGERIDCLLNPETVEVRRLAGVRSRSSDGRQLVGTGLADDPLHFTGGGRTELVLDLVFDVDLVESPAAPTDVRELTGPLWRLAENSAQERGALRPPLVRLVWGKSWNLPGVIVAVAERFDAFGPTGVPKRSWLRLKLVRVAESAEAVQRSFDQELSAAQSTPTVARPGGGVEVVGDGGATAGPEPGTATRFDLVAAEALGNPLRWRLLAEYNGLDNPLEVPGGTVLRIPPGGAS
jgi:hypothetical protein